MNEHVIKGNCIFFFIFWFITFSNRYISLYSLEKKELVLLVELYESYGQLKTHTGPHTYDTNVMSCMELWYTKAKENTLYKQQFFYA